MEVNDTPRVLSDRYELRHLVARGGMAEVYRAHDRLLDRPVALKILFPELSVDRSFVERFRREAQAAANLSNPNIVPVFDWGEDTSTYFIVMEYVDGRALSTILRGAGPLHPERAAEIAAEVAGALSYAHRHGVVHRDVKPGNVLITDEGAVKVTDFGIARAVNTEESLTQTGAVMGTATYFSPEQAEGRSVDARGDVYSLGVVLFEMVTGRPPFLGESPVAVASKHVREAPPTPREVNPSVPPALEAIILTCLAKSPDGRYQSADELRHDLLRFREGRAVHAGPDAAAATRPAATTPPTSTTRAMAAFNGTQSLPVVTAPVAADAERSGHTGWWVALLLVLLAALGVVVFFLGRTLGWWHTTTSAAVPAKVAVPQVANDTVGQATSTLQGQGLKVDPRGASNTATVTRTVPAAGARVNKGTTVELFTQRVAVPTGIPVPDETNQSVSIAQKDLSKLGLVPSVQYVQNDTSCQVNVVCRQTPAGGTTAHKGESVTLFTAAPAASSNVTVPDVQGLSQNTACSLLGSYGLQCSASTVQQPSDAVKPGQVITTQPAPGTSQAKGTPITLVVSSGPVVPKVVGDTAGSAERTLSGDGYVPQPDSTCSDPTSTVVSQSPAPGTAAPAGTSVTISCSASTSSGSSSSGSSTGSTSSTSSSSSGSSSSSSSSSAGGSSSSALRSVAARPASGATA